MVDKKELKKIMNALDRKKEANRCFTVKILGNDEDKLAAFSILMDSQESFYGDRKDIYHYVERSTIKLFKKAKIKHKVIT